MCLLLSQEYVHLYLISLLDFINYYNDDKKMNVANINLRLFYTSCHCYLFYYFTFKCYYFHNLEVVSPFSLT